MILDAEAFLILDGHDVGHNPIVRLVFNRVAIREGLETERHESLSMGQTRPSLRAQLRAR